MQVWRGVTELFSHLGSLPSEQVTPGRGNGPSASSWKTIPASASVASSVTPKLPSPTVVRPRPCSSNRKSGRASTHGFAHGFVAGPAIDDAGSWWKRTARSCANHVAAGNIPADIAIAPSRPSIGSGRVRTRRPDASRARLPSLKPRSPVRYVL